MLKSSSCSSGVKDGLGDPCSAGDAADWSAPCAAPGGCDRRSCGVHCDSRRRDKSNRQARGRRGRVLCTLSAEHVNPTCVTPTLSSRNANEPCGALQALSLSVCMMTARLSPSSRLSARCVVGVGSGGVGSVGGAGLLPGGLFSQRSCVVPLACLVASAVESGPVRDHRELPGVARAGGNSARCAP